MASLDDVVSNLKNVVTNLSGLATNTSVVNVLTSINTTLIGIGTALASAHMFGGTLTMTVGTVTIVADPHVLSNSRIMCFPTNTTACALIYDLEGFYTSAKTPGASFTLQTIFTSALGSETFDYIGFNQ